MFPENSQNVLTWRSVAPLYNFARWIWKTTRLNPYVALGGHEPIFAATCFACQSEITKSLLNRVVILKQMDSFKSTWLKTDFWQERIYLVAGGGLRKLHAIAFAEAPCIWIPKSCAGQLVYTPSVLWKEISPYNRGLKNSLFGMINKDIYYAMVFEDGYSAPTIGYLFCFARWWA